MQTLDLTVNPRYLTNINFDIGDFYFALNTINNGEHESLVSFDQLIRSKKNDNFMTIFLVTIKIESLLNFHQGRRPYF